MKSLLEIPDAFWSTGETAIILCGVMTGYFFRYRFRRGEQISIQPWLKFFLYFLAFAALWRICYVATTARYWIFCTVITTVIGCALLSSALEISSARRRCLLGAVIASLTIASLGLAGNLFFRPQRKAGLFKAIEIIRRETRGAEFPRIIALNKDARRMQWYGGWPDSQFQVTSQSALWKELAKALRGHDRIVVVYRRNESASLPRPEEIKTFLRRHSVENAAITSRSTEVIRNHVLEMITIRNHEAPFFGTSRPLPPHSPETVILSEDFNSSNTPIAISLRNKDTAGIYTMPFPDTLRLRVPEGGIPAPDRINIKLVSVTEAEHGLEIGPGALGVAGKTNFPARKYSIDVCVSGEIGSRLLVTVYPVGIKRPCPPRTFHLATVMNDGFRERRVSLPDFQEDCREIWLSWHSSGKIRLKKLVVSEDTSSRVESNIELE